MRLAILLVLALVVGHVIGLGQVFSALDYADHAAKRAYTDIAPHLDRVGQDLKREYQEAQRGRSH